MTDSPPSPSSSSSCWRILLLVILTILSVTIGGIYRESFIPKHQTSSSSEIEVQTIMAPLPPATLAESFLRVSEVSGLEKILVLCIDSVECRKFTLFLGQLPDSVVFMDLPSLPPKTESQEEDQSLLLVSPLVKYLIVKTVPCQGGDLCASHRALRPNHTLLFIQNPFSLYSQILSRSHSQYNFSEEINDNPRTGCGDLSNVFLQTDVWWGDSLLTNLPIGWFAYEHFLNFESEIVDTFNKVFVLPSASVRFQPLSSVTRSLREIVEYNRKNCILSSTSGSSSHSVTQTAIEDLEQYLSSKDGNSLYSWKDEDSREGNDETENNKPGEDDPRVKDWLNQWAPKSWAFYSTLKSTGNPFPKNFRIDKKQLRCE